jgi:hypothetical protein
MRFIFLILYLAIVSCQYNVRELKAASSRGSSSTKTTYSKSYSSRSSRSSYNKNYASNGVYTYSSYKNPTSYTNNYYSVSLGRTSQPLYVYYRAPNYYN